MFPLEKAARLALEYLEQGQVLQQVVQEQGQAGTGVTGVGAGTALITVCADSIIVGAVVTFSTAVDTVASAVTFSVKDVFAVFNAVTVF